MADPEMPVVLIWPGSRGRWGIVPFRLKREVRSDVHYKAIDADGMEWEDDERPATMITAPQQRPNQPEAVYFLEAIGKRGTRKLFLSKTRVFEGKGYGTAKMLIRSAWVSDPDCCTVVICSGRSRTLLYEEQRLYCKMV
ncbi:hypothetical protein R1sor_012739 [Riccia sorocarpa]|uniref:Uncharacterized protein n=1 Tax=Riccia sorocarpa TaxID=122646 RepID=A0ABD3I4Z0_9MARC